MPVRKHFCVYEVVRKADVYFDLDVHKYNNTSNMKELALNMADVGELAFEPAECKFIVVDAEYADEKLKFHIHEEQKN